MLRSADPTVIVYAKILALWQMNMFWALYLDFHATEINIDKIGGLNSFETPQSQPVLTFMRLVEPSFNVFSRRQISVRICSG